MYVERHVHTSRIRKNPNERGQELPPSLLPPSVNIEQGSEPDETHQRLCHLSSDIQDQKVANAHTTTPTVIRQRQSLPTMQLIFAARRGRRVLHQVNLQQTASLSTRVPIAVSHVRRVFRLADTRPAAPTGSSTLKQLGAALPRNQYSTTQTTTSADPSKPKRRGRPPKGGEAKPKKKAPKKRKPKKKVKKVAKLSEDALEKRRKQRQEQKVKDTIKTLISESLKKEEPKLRSPIAWNLFVSEKLKGVDRESKGSALRDIGAQYRELPESQREVCFPTLM